MIDFQSQLTGVAGSSAIDQKSDAGMSSPGGSNERSECHFLCCSGVETGEGELNLRGRQSALIRVHVPAASVFIRVHPWLKPGLLAVQAGSIQGFPRPFKAIKAYPSLLKGFWKKNYSFGQPSTFNFQRATDSGLLGPIPDPLPPGVPIATPYLRNFKTF
jgi:hypothetical protein